MYIYIYMYIYIVIYIVIYIYGYPQHPPALNFGLLAKSTKSQPRNIKNAPGSFLEQEKCPWKIIPESYPISSIPSCDSNATTVGYCWCLLLAPNQWRKSLYDLPVWDEQIARMVWKTAKLLKTRKPMNQRQVKREPWSQCQKNQNRIAQFDYVRCVHPWFVTRIIPEKLRVSKLKMCGFPNYGKLRLFPGKA
jgi:hypothetical protein